MKILTIYFFIIITAVQIWGQSSSFITKFGDFSSATSFSINPAGYIFVADKNKNEIFKFDTSSNLIKSTGGFGWATDQFDDPADIFATILRIYVADKNNNRIEIFDKNLNFLSSFTAKSNKDMQYSFAYPTCVGISNQGDMYILDSDNSRILKFNLNRIFLQEIGNYDSGKFMLGNPKQFAISPDGEIFVINNGIIFVFDQYGNGLLKFKLPFAAKNINVTFNYLTITGSSQVYYADLNKRTIELSKFNLPKKPES